MKKIDLKKGTGIFLLGYMILMLGFIVALACIEQMKRYNNAVETQMAADAVSDGVASYMTVNNVDYEDAYAHAEEIASLYNQNTQIYISSVALDQEKFEQDNRARVAVTSIYAETSNADDIYGTNGNNADDYAIRRISETMFTKSVGGSLLWPVSTGGLITSYFGPRESPGGIGSTNHQGLDIGCPTGTPILACESGTVIAAQYNNVMGNYVKIMHNNSMQTVYMHNSVLEVTVGQKVSRGEEIALAGSTGRSTGPHCHISVIIDGTNVDPLLYLQQPN